MERALFPLLPVLIIDDEEDVLKSFTILLQSTGINNIICCSDSRKALDILSKQEASIILLDLFMSHVSGEQLLLKIGQRSPDIPVIIVTASNRLESAISCMKMGAYDYLTKPIDEDVFVNVVRRAIELREIRLENKKLKKSVLSPGLENPDAFSGIITRNKTMLSLFHYIEAMSASPEPVLITGESGVGKELIARAIHLHSKRKGGFIPVNIAGLDDHLFNDTLFGHRKGAFTGADETRDGLIEKASGGTLFLDEIGNLSLELQVKLLRLLQEKEYYPIGSDLPIISDARIILASNLDIKGLVESNRFRKDLYYRLNTHHIHIPPLRERKEDIPLLVEHFIKEATHLFGKKVPPPPGELYKTLSTYSFPGNVRELRSIVFDAVSKHKSKMFSVEDFTNRILQEEGSAERNIHPIPGEGASKVVFSEDLPTLKEATQLLIDEALRRANGNQSHAARLLGISPQALSKRLKGVKSSSSPSFNQS